MKPSVFKFVDYNYNLSSGIVVFKYAIGKYTFHEKLILPKNSNKLNKTQEEALDKALFNLFLMAGISYYKTYTPKNINIGKYSLNHEQACFWNKIYTKGLGEFFYVNKIDFRGLVNFPVSNVKVKATNIKTVGKSLVPIGGGKDSIVTIEKLKSKKEKLDLFSLRELDVIQAVARVSGENLITVDRKIDPQLLKLNGKPGVYNGHIPFNAYLAFLTEVIAIIYGYKQIILSNEKSAKYGNVKYLGTMINHQWSKSEEFEKMFQDYTRKFITPNVKYFSLLRQMNELDIAGEFVKHKKYFKVFSSCNKNFKLSGKAKKRWCGECPKCAFTFGLLSAYLPEKELINIFGSNYYEDEKLNDLFLELLGEKNIKPFECVGTPDEMKTAMCAATRNGIIKKEYLILGFGREGASSLRYLLKNNIEAKHITVADKNNLSQFDDKYKQLLKKSDVNLQLGKNYITNLTDYDVIIKTSGIKLNKKTIGQLENSGVELTTNLNIFLNNVKGKVIGVTGTKGKSTTTGLIYEILKADDRKAILCGNIGKPFLDYLNQDSAKTIYIAELSSYQLDTLKGAVDVGVMTSFFPEHLDYHGSKKEYLNAKLNLARNCKIFVYNKNLTAKLKNIRAKKVPYGSVKLKTALTGIHNQQNIAGAIEVAKIFKVSNATISKAIKNFKPLPHRLELVGAFKGVKFYNDVLSTTPESTIEAIRSIKPETIIVGGFDRGLDYKNLAKKIVKSDIKNVIYWPHSGKKISKLIRTSKKHQIKLVPVKNMRETIKESFKLSKSGDTVLLSPAASSYDFYKNYTEKGEAFKTEIKNCVK